MNKQTHLADYDKAAVIAIQLKGVYFEKSPIEKTIQTHIQARPMKP